MRWSKLPVLLLPLLAAAACNDSTGIGATGQARVYMSVTGNTSASIAGISADYLAMNSLTLDNVDSLFVRVTGISIVRAGDDTSDAGGWVTLALADSGGQRVNLLKLAEEDSALFAQDEVQVGRYNMLRLQFDSASIVLKNDVTVGGFAFQAGTVYTLRVPSGEIKIPLPSFTVGEDSVSTLNLEVEEHPTIANIQATGSGVLQLSPVIHVK